MRQPDRGAPRRGQRGAIMRTLMTLLLVLTCMTLLVAVGFLLAELNHRRFRLALSGGALQVERGLFLPYGFAAYEADTPELRAAYAPVPIPVGETPTGALGPFDERVDLDRALFALLSAWAERRREAPDAATQELAAGFVLRLEALPGLSEEQRRALRTLRASFAIHNGRRMLLEVVAQLRRAQEEFRLAVQLGSPNSAEAQRWVEQLDRRIPMCLDIAPPSEARPPPP